MPFSPISVKSPAGKISISGSRQQSFITFLYFSSLNGEPNVILFLNVSFCIHAVCGQYPILPSNSISPLTFFISPINADNKEDLPDPTDPIIPTNLPLGMVNWMLRKWDFGT